MTLPCKNKTINNQKRHIYRSFLVELRDLTNWLLNYFGNLLKRAPTINFVASTEQLLLFFSVALIILLDITTIQTYSNEKPCVV